MQRWSQAERKGDGRLSPKHSLINKFSEVEGQRIIHICKQPEYANLSPCSLVTVLADQGIYITSESTIYRVLKAHNQDKHLLKRKPQKTIVKPEALIATGPNQIYRWDITYLPTSVKGYFTIYILSWIFTVEKLLAKPCL